jgi:thioredoxin-like negative regulator of GroEL
MRNRLRLPVPKAIGVLCALFVFLPTMRAQEPARVDISPFGVVGLAPAETLTLKATGVLPSEGCKAQLGFDDASGMSMNRSLNVNLAPGQSAFTTYLAKNRGDGRTAVRPVAWVERSLGSGVKCALAVYVKSEIQKKEELREISSGSDCQGANCKGVLVGDLSRLTLRLYVAATSRPCRAQMGFRQSNGRTSITAKYVTLMPRRAAWLDWHQGDDDLASTDSVTPVVAYHPGDSCIASSEVFAGENEPATADVAVHSYESSAVGLAVDPESVEKTIQTLKNALQTGPDGLWVINALAQAYDRHGERQLAIKLLSNHLEINPRASESWLLLAKFQFEQTQYSSAAVSLEKCLALDPNNMTAKAGYADSLTRLGRLDEAAKLFAPLLKDDKTRTPAVLTSYAELLYTEGRFDEALAPVEESDARHPRCGRTLWVKAQVLQALERLPEATQAAERAVQIDPNFISARLLLMSLYHRQGKMQEAAEQSAWLKNNAVNAYK